MLFVLCLLLLFINDLPFPFKCHVRHRISYRTTMEHFHLFTSQFIFNHCLHTNESWQYVSECRHIWGEPAVYLACHNLIAMVYVALCSTSIHFFRILGTIAQYIAALLLIYVPYAKHESEIVLISLLLICDNIHLFVISEIFGTFLRNKVSYRFNMNMPK